jgi:hypothetical protein
MSAYLRTVDAAVKRPRVSPSVSGTLVLLAAAQGAALHPRPADAHRAHDASPPEFYKELYRLRGWEYPTGTSARPPLVGTLTNNIVYDRLAPGVREALDSMVPRDEKGRLKHHKHRHLTEDVGRAVPCRLAYDRAATTEDS